MKYLLFFLLFIGISHIAPSSTKLPQHYGEIKIIMQAKDFRNSDWFDNLNCPLARSITKQLRLPGVCVGYDAGYYYDGKDIYEFDIIGGYGRGQYDRDRMRSVFSSNEAMIRIVYIKMKK